MTCSSMGFNTWITINSIMPDKDKLDLLLEDWQDTPKRDPQLTHRVWSRIAVDDSSRDSRITNWFNWLSNTLTRPLGAAAFITACVVCGITIAQLRVSYEKQTRIDHLAQDYIQLIKSQQDPIETEATR